MPLLLLASMLVGTWVGGVLSKTPEGLEVLNYWIKPFGQIFLNLLFTVLVPLVFASIAGAVANLGNGTKLGPLLGRMMFVFIITGLIASVLMLAVSALVPLKATLLPNVTAQEVVRTSLSQQIVDALTVSDFNLLLSKKAMLPLILFSVLVGLATRQLGAVAEPFRLWINALNEIMMKLVSYIMYIAPLGMFAWFAFLRGTFGSDLMTTLYQSVALFFPVAFFYYFVFFSLYVFWAAGRKGFRKFWGHIAPASMVAFGTGSSMATIPANLEAARKIGIPRSIRELVIPIGATIHMDGSCISAICKIALLASLYNYELHSVGGWLTAISVAILSGTVMSGIPGGGKVGELLILSLYGFPAEGLILISALGDLVDAPATALNSIGDNVASMMVSRLEGGPNWMPEGTANE